MKTSIKKNTTKTNSTEKANVEIIKKDVAKKTKITQKKTVLYKTKESTRDFRNKRRKEIKKAYKNIILNESGVKRSNKELVSFSKSTEGKKAFNEFKKNYIEHYLINDYSLRSLTTSKDSSTIEDIKELIAGLKLFLTATELKKVESIKA